MPVQRAQEIIDRAAEERRRLIEFVRRVQADHWRDHSPGGSWQARDYVAHLAAIDLPLTAWFQALQAPGRQGGPGSAFDIDQWNEEQVLARRDCTIDQLLDEMGRHREDLAAALADFTDEQLDSTIHFGGDSKRAPRDLPLYSFLSAWVFHDRWHMEDARRAVAGGPEQPFGDEAFARALGEQEEAEGPSWPSRGGGGLA